MLTPPTQQELAALRMAIPAWHDRMTAHFAGKKAQCLPALHFAGLEIADLRARNAALLALIDAQQKQLAVDLAPEPAGQFKRNQQAGVHGMADCMDMVRCELIDAGIIAKTVAPMFVADAVLAYIRAQQKQLADLRGAAGFAAECGVPADGVGL